MVSDAELLDLSEEVGQALAAAGQCIAVAESCTGGWLAKCLTDIAGSSGWFDRGFVTYTNQAKQDLLAVIPQTLDSHGAVSEETVMEMARGARARSEAQLTVAISGIAGPGGAVPGKPVGTVCFAWCGASEKTQTKCFEGDRADVRRQAVAHALRGVLEMMHA